MRPADLRLLLNAALLLLSLALAGQMAHEHAAAQEPPWLDLATGRALAEAQAFPRSEPFLFTAAPGSGFDTGHWGYALAAWWLERLYGSGALRLADTLALAAAFLLLLMAGFQRGSRPFSTALFSLAALAAALPLTRPGSGALALACGAGALALMEGPFWRAFSGRWVWLAPLAVVWANLHPSAWGLVPVCALWLLTDGAVLEEGAPSHPRLAKAVTFLLLGACLLLNPATFRAPWQALSHAAPSALAPALFPQTQAGLLLLILGFLLTVASSWAPAGRQGLRRDSVLLGLLSAASLASASALPFACLYAAILAAARADVLVDALPSPAQGLRWLLKLAALAAGAWLLWRPLPWGGAIDDAPVPALPKQTLGFYRDELLDARLLVEEGWEPRALWELGPPVRVSSLPGARLSNAARPALRQVLRAEPGWQGLAGQLGADAALLRIGSALARAMATARDWQPVSFDNDSVLYLRALPQHQALISRHAPRGLRPGDQAEPLDPSRLDQAEADLEARLAASPGLGRLHWMKARLALEKGRPSKARQALEEGLRADPGFGPAYALLAELRTKAGDSPGARKLYARAARLERDALRRRELESLAEGR